MASVAAYSLPPFLFAGAAFTGASIVHLALSPLRALAIPYPALLDHWYFLVPGACALLWLGMLRRRPVLAATVAVVLCFAAMPAVQWYANAQVARVPATRFLTPEERQALKAIPVRVLEQYTSGRGHEVFVSPGDEQRLRQELERVGVLRANDR
jgi:hypothetical protein